MCRKYLFESFNTVYIYFIILWEEMRTRKQEKQLSETP